MVAQLIHRLTLADPKFLGYARSRPRSSQAHFDSTLAFRIILKPADLSLPVVFRAWLYSTTEGDSRLNLGVLLPLVRPPSPNHWQQYFAEHPAPPVETLLSRMILGASKVAGSDKKKRTPAQTADAIVSAFAAHLNCLAPKEMALEYSFLDVLISYSCKENRPFIRELAKSAKFWEANTQMMRRSLEEKSKGAAMTFMDAMATVSAALQAVKDEGREWIDAVVRNVVVSGLFDVLEESVALIMSFTRGPSTCTHRVETDMFLLTVYLPVIMTEIITCITSSLSNETRTIVRAQLPRPRLIKRLMIYGAIQEVQQTKQLEHGSEDASNNNERKRPEVTIWSQKAWQSLMGLTLSSGKDNAHCARRSCEEPSSDAEEASCGACKKFKYCSKECLERYVASLSFRTGTPTNVISRTSSGRDVSEHEAICGWLFVGGRPDGLETNGEPTAKEDPSTVPAVAEEASAVTGEFSALRISD